jgi:hypothetical protein
MRGRHRSRATLHHASALVESIDRFVPSNDEITFIDNSPMQEREALNDYFTEQVVGAPFVVEMGPSDNLRREPTRGMKLHLLEAQFEILGHAARGLMSPIEGDAGLGKPVSTVVLARTRRRLMVLALFAILSLWSAGLWWVFQRFAA